MCPTGRDSRSAKENGVHHPRRASSGFFGVIANAFGSASSNDEPSVKQQPKTQRHGGSGSSRQNTKRSLTSDAARSPHNAVSKVPTRLGENELGRYAFEDKMPKSLKKLLKRPEDNISDGIVLAVEKLLTQCPSTQFAYLCSSRVHHVSKTRGEGSFCGYRSIQMLISYLKQTELPGADNFSGGLPSILKIQDLIEDAWDQGINPHGRLETGGIRGTRKFIGTPEAHTLFTSLGIGCSAAAFRGYEQWRACDELLHSTLKYFEAGLKQSAKGRKVQRTALPPVYLQHQGHSMTIIGIECRNDELGLLVFDPAHSDPTLVKKLVRSSPKRLTTTPSRLLRHYRCGHRYLRKYNEFELLFLDRDLTTTSKPENQLRSEPDP